MLARIGRSWGIIGRGLAVICVGGVVACLYLGLRVVPAASAAGKLEILPAVQDLGTVDQNATLKVEFVLKNGLSREVTVADIVKSCSCTEALVQPQLIPPGTEGKLHVTWRTNRRRGDATESLLVLFNDGTHSPLQLAAKFKAVVTPAVILSESTIQFVSTDPSPQHLSLKANPGHSVALIKAVANHHSLRCKIEIKSNMVTIEFDPKVPGWESGQLNVTVLTGCPEEPEITIPVVIKQF